MAERRKDLPAGLDFSAQGPAKPVPAATVVIVRQLTSGDAIEIFCVQRHQGVAFMGGALVFPGGKLDPPDRAWPGAVAREPDPRGLLLVGDAEEPAAELRALAVAACREAVEEAAIVPALRPDGTPIGDADAVVVREALEGGLGLAAILAGREAALDLGALVPFARWITPEAEPRRYDARFFLLPLPAGQEGRHDGKETTRGFWDTPGGVLARFAAGEVQLAPPTTRCLELLQGAGSFADARAIAETQSLLPVCPTFVPEDPPALALPGDPAHPIQERRVEGPTRFVLRDGRFVSEDPPT